MPDGERSNAATATTGGDTAAPAFTDAQVDALATLFTRLGPGNLRWLIGQVLGPGSIAEAGDAVDDVQRLARFAADAINRAGRIGDAIARLRTEAPHDLYLMAGLDRVVRGEPVDDNLQRLINDYEPFFNSRELQTLLARVSQRVCAIGVGPTPGALLGSGFLIGPDLVMTNHHVVAGLVTAGAGNRVLTRTPEGDVYCYFDYFAAPAPTIGNTKPPTISIQCTRGWLIHARLDEPLDGKEDCPTDPDYMRQRLDYAILRLSAPIGRRPARAGGGSLRGWFSLPDRIETLTPNKRLIIVQHPNRAPQQLDFGTYSQLDPSGTRVWYSVNTADGSSGGAVVDSDGRLFAIHNAAVDPPARKVNQGVRIDLIEEDLRANAPTALVEPPGEDPLAFWSLNDNPTDPRPVLGRRAFRENVLAATAASGRRVVVVVGPPGSGVRFSAQILRRIVGSRPIVEFNPTALQTLSPTTFVRAITEDLGVSTDPSKIPQPNSTESWPRWVRLDLPAWLAAQLAADETRGAAKYPAWVVVNAVVQDGERLFWAEQLKDLVAALVGAHDPGQRAIDIPQLRWLFLTRNAAAISVTGVDRHEDDLTDQDVPDPADPLRYPSYCYEFVECLDRAWRSIDATPDEGNTIKLAGVADALVQLSNLQTAPNQPAPQPPRQLLAGYVRTMISRRVAGVP